MSKRQRSDSACEEKVISEYVDSCLQFKTDLSFVDVQSFTKDTPVASHVLLVGTPDQLKEKYVESLPTYCPLVAEAIVRTAADSTTTVLAQLNGSASYAKVTVAAIPPNASRTNCPYRPDFVTGSVHNVMCSMDKDADQLDVFVCAPTGAEVALSVAVARGSKHSFSAKKGNATKAYCEQNVKVRVVFSSRALFTGEKINGKTVTVAELEAICTSVQLCQRLVDTPPNLLDTVVFAEIATGYARALGVEVDVIKGEELQNRGYGGIYGVGKGAQYPPHLVTLRYHNHKASNGKNIALVGKGIVYDCGGLALKPAQFMTNMKTDMGGAAAVFCGFVAMVRCAKVQSDHYHDIANLSVTLCLAENAIGPNAFRNDDILVFKSGKSVEVMNTDAEGRLVLADGVFHATNEQDFLPDVLIDMATLTGAQGIATGRKHAAIYVNEVSTEEDILSAGRQCGDTCFPVVYCPEYHAPEYKSPCADMRNLMAVTNNACVSCGGHFVAENVSERFKGAHVHVDLAFPSFDANGGTGFGVSLITEYCKKF